MRVVHLHHSPLPLIFFLCLVVLLLAGFGLCSAADHQDHRKTTTFEVVGFGECADCKENDFQTSQAFSGLHVTIDCKLKTGEMKRVGASKLDDEGKFKILLPQNIIQEEEEGQKLKHKCYAQLHNAAAMPCPSHNGLSNIVFVSHVNHKHYTFSPSKPLKFSTPLCTSKFLWPHYKYPHHWNKNIPQIPYHLSHPWKKNIPKIPLPPHPCKKNIPKIPFPPTLHKHKLHNLVILPPSPVPYIKSPHPPLYKKPFPPSTTHKLPRLPKIHPKYFFKHPKYGFVPPKPQP